MATFLITKSMIPVIKESFKHGVCATFSRRQWYDNDICGSNRYGTIRFHEIGENIFIKVTNDVRRTILSYLVSK